jgi:hypothetical protein
MSDHDNRRQYSRYNAPICYRSASLFSARKPLVNISLGGIRIFSDDEFKVGRRLELELILPNDTILTCTAKVVWQSPLPEGAPAKYDTGLQFLDISTDSIHQLSGFLDREPPMQE